jgi:hypothetical protein
MHNILFCIFLNSLLTLPRHVSAFILPFSRGFPFQGGSHVNPLENGNINAETCRGRVRTEDIYTKRNIVHCCFKFTEI